jgi:diguanylate cyclase (GGDEF)-like protein
MGVRTRVVITMVVCAWLGVMVAAAEVLAASQANARQQIDQRFETRVASSAVFSSLYVQDIFSRERRQAATWLTGRATPASLEHAAGAVGFSASVLLDQHGRVIQAAPSKPGLLGQVITGKYPHLATAVHGSAAVSNVVLSAARGLAVVAFAVPFQASSGRRVFSGAFDLANTPLGAYMSHMISTPGRHVYLVDATGNVIANSGPGLKARTTLGLIDPRLAGILATRSGGSYASAHGGHFFASVPVSGTTWRLVADVPANELYISVDGSNRRLSWLALAGLALAGLLIILLGSRLVRSRKHLRRLNGELDRLARVDSLTALRNRRDIEERLHAELSAARRHKSDLAVLLIDIDHFKRVNDTHGHQAGDVVLTTTAKEIESMLRAEDSVGRWGGEEFLAVLPNTDADGAVTIAERLRVQVAEPRFGGTDHVAPITVTIGVAVWGEGGIDELISRADNALYAGKAAGRNKVRLAGIEPSSTDVRAGRLTRRPVGGRGLHSPPQPLEEHRTSVRRS